MSDDVCISVRGVSKKFSRSLKRSFIYGAQDLLRVMSGRQLGDQLRPTEFWALRDISFDLLRGKSIGLIGLNGSGKTTLLRMVSGILRPTTGSIQVNGKIAPMLALGAGFKPVFSGRENVFLNLSLLGVSDRDIKKRFDSIVDFSELQHAIDAPLGTYSSGMLARLGFACAIHTDPSILIVDEVLSVGDAKFRMKCRNKINELRRAGTSMLLVSHSSLMIETLSDECIFLQQGQVMLQGPPSKVIKAYEEAELIQATAQNTVKSLEVATRQVNQDTPVILSSVVVQQVNSNEHGYWLSGAPGELSILIKVLSTVEDISINLIISDLTHNPGETVLFMMSSRDLGWLRFTPGNSDLTLQLPIVGLRPGTYRVKLSVSKGQMHDIIDVVENIKLIVRDAGKSTNSLYFQERNWEVNRGEISVSENIDIYEENLVEDNESF